MQAQSLRLRDFEQFPAFAPAWKQYAMHIQNRWFSMIFFASNGYHRSTCSHWRVDQSTGQGASTRRQAAKWSMPIVLNLFLLCSSARISSIYQALGGFIWFIIRESFGLKTYPARLKKKQTSPERTGLAMRLWGTSMLANRGGFMMDNI